jgi:hypothetical protein
MNNTSINYFNRKIDISFFPKKKEDASQLLGFGGSHAPSISGPLKASQNYIRVLLSSAGERSEDPSLGTKLIKDFSSKNMIFPMQISQNFAINSLLATNYLRKNYSSDTPADERVLGAKLLNYSIVGKTYINLEIELKTESKDALVFLLPVHF